MRAIAHPEYRTYMQDREACHRCRQAVAAWKASGEPIVAAKYSLSWTFERMQRFVRSLARLFQEYNRVLWERFPYCRRCRGGCCVLDATHVSPFDAIALALLGRPFPTLPEEASATARDCIYLTGTECAWSAEWRPIKCWSFYCLGGRWETTDSLERRYSLVTEELGQVVHDLLPDALRRYETVCGDSLVAHLGDPIDFAHALGDALYEVFVAPFHDRYPAIGENGGPNVGTAKDAALDVTSAVLAFVTEAVEEACASPPQTPEGLETSPDQLLADLELLEWIVLGHPGDGTELLEGLDSRYARVPAPNRGEHPTVWSRMRDCVRHLRNHWDG